LRRFVPVAAPAKAADPIEHVTLSRFCNRTAGPVIFRSWRRWLARRAGPLLWNRALSNNPADFFSADPVEEIGIGNIISFVDGGKGYIMDIKSAISLYEHAATNGEPALNPFNRAPLPTSFKRRVALHGKAKAGWTALKATSETQVTSLATTDVFRAIEDLGYYTDPGWFMELSRVELQRLYMELADIWYHRASLTGTDQRRIVPPPARPFPLSTHAILVMQQRALRPLLLETCRLLVSASVTRSDKQLGVMYVLGALSIVSAGAGSAYPWLVEMFAPGCVTRIVAGQIVAIHPSVMAY